MAKKKAAEAVAASEPAAEAPVVETAPAPEPAQETPAAAPKSAKVPAGPITVKYRDHKGEPVERTFSKEDHGDDFAKLAEEFKATNADKLIA